MSDKIKLSLHLSRDTDERLERLCDESGITKSELLRRSLALMEIAIDIKKKGNHLAVLNKNDHKVSDIIGL